MHADAVGRADRRQREHRRHRVARAARRASRSSRRRASRPARPSLGGAITTAGDLVFIAATIDGYFRAFDARNGAELWSTKLDGAGARDSVDLHGQGRQAVRGDHGRRRRIPAQPAESTQSSRSGCREERSAMRSTASRCTRVASSFVLVVLGAASAAGRRAAGAAARPGGRRARRATRKVVLAWADTRNGIAQHEFTSHALSVIERLGYESGAYDTFIRTDSNIIAQQPKRTTGEPASGGPTLRDGRRDFLPRPSRRADRRGAEEGTGRVRAETARASSPRTPR